jgi:nondiscriminating glutamyl-tRNA synthetase
MVRVRFAPSPTGYLHIGNARTALFNYLFAAKNGGELILRIEDTDKERSKEEYVARICEDLQWLGITWSEGPDCGGEYGPYRQSERTHLYHDYITKLVDRGEAYYCFCSEKELEDRRKAQLDKGDSAIYDGRCRRLTKEEAEKKIATGENPSIRFRMPAKKIIVKDIIRGDVEFDGAVIGDFVIVRPDGSPTFHLAVCIDDGLMKITHVIRGEDHFSNTPKHIALFEACGFSVPAFAHMPLTMGPGGEPLSKRLGAMSLGEYKKSGYLPHALANYMALLGWSPGDDQELFSFDELQKKFTLERVSRSSAVFDIVKLNWVNAEHIRRMDDDAYVKGCVHYILQEKIVEKDVHRKRPEWYEKVFLALKDNIQSFQDLESRLKLFSDEFPYENEELLKTETARSVLSQLLKLLRDAENIDDDWYDKMLKELKKKTKAKGKELFLPLRVAITGCEHGPELKRFVVLLGKSACMKRIEKALSLSAEG